MVMLLFILWTDLFLLIFNSFYEGTILSEQLSFFTFFILLYQWSILVDSQTLYFQLLAFPEHLIQLHSLDSVNLFCQTSQRELKGKNIILLHAFSMIFIIFFSIIRGVGRSHGIHTKSLSTGCQKQFICLMSGTCSRATCKELYETEEKDATVPLKDTSDSPLSYRTLAFVSSSSAKQEYFLHPFPFTS